MPKPSPQTTTKGTEISDLVRSHMIHLSLLVFS
jgi:hypothetical protein